MGDRPRPDPSTHLERVTHAQPLWSAADALYDYLLRTHWRSNHVLAGPDPGIRFNARVGRFVKSYASLLPWSDDLVYMQAQGYWILDNWLLHDRFGEDQYSEVAVRASESVLALQKGRGYWEYPNPEWSGRIATVEGCFAALGLLETYAHTGREEFLDGAKRWYRFMVNEVGFRAQPTPGLLAVNYFAHSSGKGGGVPNNSTLAMWMTARLAQLAGDDSYLEPAGPMLEWLVEVQRPDGELPYEVGSDRESGRLHFLCYQYNAFEFMDLVHYHRITDDDRVRPVMERLVGYLSAGLNDGVARFQCSERGPEVLYYNAAVAQALSQATDLGLADDRESVDRTYRRVLALQRPDGGFRFHSQNNYRFLSDRRSYPRYLSMTLHHLLLEGSRTEEEQDDG